MSKSSYRAQRRRQVKVMGFIFVLAMLVAGLLLGMESMLKLQRDPGGSIRAVNAWRFAGRVTLLSHSVTGIREVKFEKESLSEADRRSSSSHDVFGRPSTPDHPVLVGDSQFSYPYRDDVSLIQAFIKNAANKELILAHPVDVRRKAASWVLLMIVGLAVIGQIWTMVIGRDPLRGLPGSVKPLPPAIGQTVFVGAIVLAVWFFTVGHHVFGPVATRKVRLLMNSAKQDNAAGIAQASREGVFIDFRDDQGVTALMLAARTGAGHALDALLDAGANPNLRNINDETALMLAIQTAHPALARRLLDAAADVEAADSNGRTALHAAAERGDADSLRLILKAGADVNQPDEHGWTPLIFAAASGSADTVTALLDAGADPRRKLPDGRVAADLASFGGELGERLGKAKQ